MSRSTDPRPTLDGDPATLVDTDAEPEVIVRFTGLRKHYGATQALKGIDLEIECGRIHALVGENGAGKSTALGVLAGRVRPSAGHVELRGEEIPYGAPRALRDAGVLAVYQELTIAPLLTVEANLFLGQPLSRAGLLRQRDMSARYLQVCQEVGVQPSRPGTIAGRLSVAEQQLLEIMRVLVSDCRVILLDEPTASLAIHEREAIFRVMRQLRAKGMAIVIVSHNLDEVLDLADTITVFREGSVVRSQPRSAWSKASMVKAMLGEKADARLRDELVPDASTQPSHTTRVPQPATKPQAPGRESLLRVSGLTVPNAITDVALEVGEGEILGIAGLVGSGRSTVLRALYGLEPAATGQLWTDGRPGRLPRSVREARRLGVALLPEDRKSEGLALSMSAMDNIVLGDLTGSSYRGMLSQRTVRRRAADVGRRVAFNETRLTTPAGNLSGGNQQKLLLARWLHATPRVLLVDEPSRGVDIGARAEILCVLEEMAASGMGVVMVSSELEELAAVCHRVIVLSGGRLVGHLDAAHQPLHVSDMLHLAFGAEEGSHE